MRARKKIQKRAIKPKTQPYSIIIIPILFKICPISEDTGWQDCHNSRVNIGTLIKIFI